MRVGISDKVLIRSVKVVLLYVMLQLVLGEKVDARYPSDDCFCCRNRCSGASEGLFSLLASGWEAAVWLAR